MRTYSLRPVKLVQGHYRSCATDDPEALWGVYSCDESGHSRLTTNPTTREKAEKFAALLEMAATELDEALNSTRQMQDKDS